MLTISKDPLWSIYVNEGSKRSCLALSKIVGLITKPVLSCVLAGT